VRLFVALETPAPLRAALDAVCERGRRGGVLWVPVENAHLTLKFLGEVEEGLAADVGRALAPVAAAGASFDLAFGGAGCFPNDRAPKVIWIGVAAGAPETVRLAAAVEDALAQLGFPREERPFRAHLTIGRVKDAAAARAATRAKLETLNDFQTEAARVAALVLYQSTLTPHGSVYGSVAAFPLGGR
jgi:2'-5' RNA ligase